MATLASLDARLQKLERRTPRRYVPEPCKLPPATPEEMRIILRTLINAGVFDRNDEMEEDTGDGEES